MERELYPLSGSQFDLYASIVYGNNQLVKEFNVITFALRVAGEHDLDALGRAFNTLLRINDSLRLRMVRKWVNFYHHAVRQYFQPYQEEKLRVITCIGEGEIRRSLDAFAERTTIDLFDEKLYAAELLDYGDGIAILMRVHHICMDGYSLSLVYSELEQLYDAYSKGAPEPTIKTGSYEDVLKNYMAYKKSKDFYNDSMFILKQSARHLKMTFPAGRAIGGSPAGLYVTSIHGELFQGLNNLCAQGGFTIPHLLTCLTALTITKLTRRTQFVISPLSHGRRMFSEKRTIGNMMVPMQEFFRIDANETWNEFSQRQYRVYMQTLEHGRIPIMSMVPALCLHGVVNGFTFDYTWCEISNMDYENCEKGKFLPITREFQVMLDAYYCGVFVHPEEIRLKLGYQMKRDTPQQIEHIMQTFMSIAEKVVANPDVHVASLLGNRERNWRKKK